MATRMKIDAAVMPAFKMGSDPRNDWLRWKRAFTRFIEANAIIDDEERFNLLLVLGGIELQSYFDKVDKVQVGTLVGDGPEIQIMKFESAIYALDNYFAPQLNKRFERHQFRAMKQDQNENFEEFVFRLKDQANRCLFTDEDDMIVDQIIEGCYSTELRKKLLTEEKSLADALQIGKTMEEVQKQFRHYGRSASYAEDNSNPVIHKVANVRQTTKQVPHESSRKCYNCNRPGHIAKDIHKCPARNVTCFNCGMKGHFKACCRKRKFEDTRRQDGYKKKVYAIMENQRDESETLDKSVFYLDEGANSEKLCFKVGGVLTSMVVDSGSPANIISERTYMKLKEQRAKIINERDADQIEARYESFASKDKILFIKAFEVEISIPGEETGCWTHILVAPKAQTDLLSKSTAFALGVLRIGYNVNNVVQSNDVQTQQYNEFPKVPNMLLKIKIDDNVSSVIQPVRRLPISMEADVEKVIQDLIDKKIIERAEGTLSWVSPLVPIRKSDGRIRLCVDMRVANQAVIRENYPMPNIDAAIASIPKVTKLSKVDLESAYYHFELDPQSRDITTFVSRSGTYRFRRLMFGIKSAPELFQRAMETLFRGMEGLIIFMDDFLIHGSTDAEHDLRLAQVMNRIEELHMKINSTKSVFGVTQVEFLGHVITTSGIKPTQDKVQAILDLRPPKSLTELKSLLGMVNFVGKFIPNLSTLTHHMRGLLGKDAVFLWKQIHNEELATIKRVLGNVQSLGFYDPADETFLVTDASPVGVGAILVQTKSGLSRAIYCASRSLASHERKYCQTEKECYAIVWAMEKLYMYLYGKHFTLVTDCKPLQYLFNRVQSKPSARIERWILRLQAFDFDVRYEPGDQNLADSFSRLAVTDKSYTGESDVIKWIVDEANLTTVQLEELQNATLKDEELTMVKEAIDTGVWDDVPIEYRASTIKDDLTQYDNLILRGDRIVVPRGLRERIVQLAHIGHQGSTGIKAHLRSKVWFPGMDKMIDQTVKNCKPCQMTGLPDKPNPMTRRIPTEPWQDLAMDFKEGLPSGESLFVVVCYTSRFIQIEPMSPATSQKVIRALLKMFSSFGIPRSITADNGPQFRSSELKQFCASFGIHLNLSTPYWPEQNGAVERQMRNLGRRIKISRIQESDWKSDLLEYLLMYHSTPQETTGISPSQIMFGRQLRNKIPSIHKNQSLILEASRDRDMIMKEKTKLRADSSRRATPHSLQEGDIVIMKNMKLGSLQPTFTAEEFVVLDIKGGEVTVKSMESGKIYKRNSTHFKLLRGEGREIKESTLLGSSEEGLETISSGSSKVQERSQNGNQGTGRQRRSVNMPERFKDFVLDEH